MLRTDVVMYVIQTTEIWELFWAGQGSNSAWGLTRFGMEVKTRSLSSPERPQDCETLQMTLHRILYSTPCIFLAVGMSQARSIGGMKILDMVCQFF
jgi:hypothetical protein